MSQYADRIPIVPYDPRFPAWFCIAREFIESSVPFEVRVEHVGSTSVPGLGGKGIIDCMVMTRREDCPEVQARLTAAGLNRNSHSHPEEDRWYASGELTGPAGEAIPVHVHITWPGSECERRHLAFVQYLRAHPEEAAEYFRLKHEWRELSRGDRVVFTEMKTPYVTGVVEKAYAWLAGGEG